MLAHIARLIQILFIMCLTTSAYGLTQQEEYTQKAKLIRYIIEKVSWPAGSIPKNNFTVCVWGEIGDYQIIEKLNNQKVQNYNLNIKKVGTFSDAKKQCQMVYVGEAVNIDEQKFISTFANSPILLLGDKDKFAEHGASMNFVVIKNIVAITVNLESMHKSKLGMNIKNIDNFIVVPLAEDLK